MLYLILGFIFGLLAGYILAKIVNRVDNKKNKGGLFNEL